MDDVAIQFSIMIGLFLGVLFRYISPYLRKSIQENLPLQWENRYTALIIISLAAAIILYSQFTPPDGDVLKVFSLSFIYGLGLGEGINEAVAWFKPTRKNV